MKIDFTQYVNPIDGLTLSDWDRNEGLDISPEDAALAGIAVGNGDKEFELPAMEVDFRFTPDHKLKFAAFSVVADIRSNNSLRSIRVRSAPLVAARIFDLAKPVVQNWSLHSFEGVEVNPEHEPAPNKVDAITELTNWRDNQPNSLPSYLAQSDPNPFPGLWFFRLVINPSLENDSLYILSIQTFWRDAEFDKKHQDTTFWERADAIINLANDQSSDESISRVANSLLYAAARYNVFDYWSLHETASEFSESKPEVIERCVEQFRKMLVESFDDHLDRYSDTENGE